MSRESGPQAPHCGSLSVCYCLGEIGARVFKTSPAPEWGALLPAVVLPPTCPDVCAEGSSLHISSAHTLDLQDPDMGETRLTPDHRLTVQLPGRRDCDELIKLVGHPQLGSGTCSQPEGSVFPSLGGGRSWKHLHRTHCSHWGSGLSWGWEGVGGPKAWGHSPSRQTDRQTAGCRCILGRTDSGRGQGHGLRDEPCRGTGWDMVGVLSSPRARPSWEGGRCQPGSPHARLREHCD